MLPGEVTLYMQTPKVTVLMTTWNRASFISGAIESVRAQTFTDWELIIVDDGSEDNTPEVVREWLQKDSRIVYFREPHHGRIAIVSNVGLRAARGKYVAILDDDDYWISPLKLSSQVQFL